MARKNKVVDHFEWYYDKSKWPITLNTEDGVFYLSLTGHDKLFSGIDLAKVKSAALKWLEGNAKLKLDPVILIWTKEFSYRGHSGGHSIAFKYDRAFRGTRKDGEVIWKDWQDTGSIPDGKHSWQDCLEGEPGPSGSQPWDFKNCMVLPYTTEQWIGLRKFTEMFEKLEARLIEIGKKGQMGDLLMELYKKDLPPLLGGPTQAPVQ